MTPPLLRQTTHLGETSATRVNKQSKPPKPFYVNTIKTSKGTINIRHQNLHQEKIPFNPITPHPPPVFVPHYTPFPPNLQNPVQPAISRHLEEAHLRTDWTRDIGKTDMRQTLGRRQSASNQGMGKAPPYHLPHLCYGISISSYWSAKT